MKEDIRFIDIQLPHYSKILEALIASYGKSENIDRVEIYLYLGKEKKPLKIILKPESKFTHLNAVYLSAIFNVTTPLHSGAEGEVHIGKAQIIPKPKTKNPINSTSHYSLNIELTEESTNFTKYFIERIKVLKDELGVAKETLRLTGDIFHILPNAKKRFNIVKNRINFEHFASPGIESLSQVDIDTKSGNKPSGYTSELKTIHPNPIPSPIKKIEDYKELKVFVSSHILESDAVRAEKKWTRKLSKNTNNGDLFTTRGIDLINFGFIHGFKIEAEESANTSYVTHRTRAYSIYANIKINTTNTKEYKLTEEDIMAAAICSLEKLSLKKDENKKMDKERLSSRLTKLCSSPFRFKDINKDNVSAPKTDKTLVVPFSIVLKDIMAYGHLLEYTNHYKATFRVYDKEFKGEIKSINIHNPFATTVNTRRASPYGIKAIVNIAITQECKDTIDNLVKKIIGFEEICVGSLDSHLLNKPAGALYTIKSYAEREDIQTINIDMSLNPVKDLERFSQLVNEYSNLPFAVSADNEQAARIIYCADTEEEAVSLIMDIKGKLKNRFTENRSKQSDFSIYDNYINIEIKSFSSDNTILRVQDVVLVASKDLGKYFVIAKLQ